MNENMLSQRLKVVADFLPRGAKFADIGSDHAYLPSYVCLSDPTARAIAGEVTEGPYLSAQKTVKELKLEKRISVRKGNGLEVLKPEEVKQIVIAGMGGGLITSILETGKDKLFGVNQLVLQPNVDARTLRKWLIQNGYRISMERIMEEGGHIYEIVVAETTENKQVLTERELLLGPWLLQERAEPFRKKWTRELKKMENVITEMRKAKEVDQRKMDQFEKEIIWMKEAVKID